MRFQGSLRVVVPLFLCAGCLISDQAEGKSKPTEAERPRHLTNSLGMKLVLIEPGSFVMGSEAGDQGHRRDETAHGATLTQSFYLGTRDGHRCYRVDLGRYPRSDGRLAARALKIIDICENSSGSVKRPTSVRSITGIGLIFGLNVHCCPPTTSTRFAPAPSICCWNFDDSLFATAILVICDEWTDNQSGSIQMLLVRRGCS